MKYMEFLLEIRDPDRIDPMPTGKGFCAYWTLHTDPNRERIADVGLSTDATGEDIVTIQTKRGRTYRTDEEIIIFMHAIAGLYNMKRW